MHGPSFTGGSQPWNILVASFSNRTFVGTAPPSWETLPPNGAAEVNVGGLILSSSDGQFVPTGFSINGIACGVTGRSSGGLSSPSPMASPSPSRHPSPSPSPSRHPSPSPQSSSPPPARRCLICVKFCREKESSALRQLRWDLPPDTCKDLVGCMDEFTDDSGDYNLDFKCKNTDKHCVEVCATGSKPETKKMYTYMKSLKEGSFKVSAARQEGWQEHDARARTYHLLYSRNQDP